MKIRKTFWADNVYETLLFSCLGVLAIWYFLEGSLTLLALFGCIGFMVSIYVFNGYLWRLEMDEHGITGPGRFGPAHRATIPWKESQIQFGVRRWGIRHLIISAKGDPHQIKVAESNFSKKTLADLAWHFDHHQNRSRQP